MTSPRIARLVVASENRGKAREIHAIFSALMPDIEVVRASELDITVEYPPEGDDYTLNAVAKALAAARQTGLPAVADDSGLEVDSLGGRPGVHSSRYAATDAARVARLLDELRAFPDPEQRSARFRCVAALGLPDRTSLTAEGTWEGVIAASPTGLGGFGYDPVFVDLSSGRTAAQLLPEEKSALSHRGKALRALAEKFMARRTPENDPLIRRSTERT